MKDEEWQEMHDRTGRLLDKAKMCPDCGAWLYKGDRHGQDCFLSLEYALTHIPNISDCTRKSLENEIARMKEGKDE